MKRPSTLLWVMVVVALLSSSCKKENNNTSNDDNGTPTQELSSAKRILSFEFSDLDIAAVIDNVERTVTATVPFGTDVRALVPEIMVSKKAKVSPGSGVAMNFTNSVIYTVTAEDGSQAFYTATVMVEEPIIGDQLFVGTWGVEKIEYYNLDYAGNPIVPSMETFEFNPYDVDNGIQLIFREDKTGEMRNSSTDTLYVWNEQTEIYDVIVCPDTTLITTYTYLFDEAEVVLYLNMEYAHTYRLDIVGLTEEAFIYTNEYSERHVEKAYLRRLSYMPTKPEKPTGQRLVKTGPLLGKR